MRYTTRFVAVVAALLLGNGFAPTSDGASGDVTLKVMSFNILYGGDEVDLDTNTWCYRRAGCLETLDQVVEVIRASAADVVGLQEATMNTCRIADALGWYCDARMQIVSRHPLVDPPGADGLYVFAEVATGRVVALANVHLSSDPYAPYLADAGEPVEAVLELERSLRLPEIQEHLAGLPQLVAAGIPVFFTGDFNSPSHLDWTQETLGLRPQIAYPVDWPVSRALAEAGFRDSYREAWPDPVEREGLTWTSGYPQMGYEVHDRIDWVLVSGAAATLASALVGEGDGPDVDVALDPWPSDHRGVVSSFAVTPAEMPVLVSRNARRVFAGEALRVRWHALGRPNERVAIVPAGAGLGSALAGAATGAAVDGEVAFVTSDWPPAAYEAVLVSQGKIASRSPFWLYAAGAPTTVQTGKTTYTVGEPIDVSWSAAPGMRWDWIGLYTAGEGSDPDECLAGYCGNGGYLLWLYTKAEIEGAVTFDETAWPGRIAWPPSSGRYRFRLLLDDGYQAAAVSAPFRIVRP